ncbi:MAG TPA: hypothetical protein VKU19_35615 [Bryobacteraceae bacterium]|nr:hypothetical protein [Bryobacteraceae bacterium]
MKSRLRFVWAFSLGSAFLTASHAQTVSPKLTTAAAVTQGGVIPYFADGGGWTTSFSLTCLSTPACALTFTYVGSNGSNLAVPMKITLPGSSGPTQTTATQSSIDIALAFGQGALIETLGQNPDVRTGGIDIVSSSLLAGFSTFRQSVPGRPDNEATVPMEDRNFNGRFIIGFDNRSGFATGVALTNLTNNARADVVVTGIDLNNQALFTGLISLDPLNGTTFNVAEKFPATAGKVGLLNFQAQNAFITGTGFRFNPGGAFTTLPIFQLH